MSEDTDEERHYTNQNIRKLGWFFFNNVELFPGGNHIYATLTDEFGWQSDESNPMYINVPDTSNTINNIEIYEETFAQPIISISSGEKFYIEAINDPQNVAEIDSIEVRVSSEATDPNGIIVRLEETAVDSGDYRGSITVKDISQLIAVFLKDRNTIYAGLHGEKITVTLLSDPTVYSDIAYIDSNSPKIKDIFSSTHPSFAQYHFTGSNMGWYSRTPDDGDNILNMSDERTSDNFLRFVKGEEGSDFSYIISESAVDCGKYPIWSFDYRTEQGISFNLYLEIGSKLYFIPLTGDETGDEMMYNLDVRGSMLDGGGGISEIVADGNWHNMEFDISYLIDNYISVNTPTASAVNLDENKYDAVKVYFGDWICDNFFIYKSQNQTGSYFDIDNFIMESADPLSIGDAADIKISWTGDETGLKYASVFSTIRGLEPDYSLMNVNTSFEGYSDQLIGNELFYYLNLAAIDPAGNRSCVYPYRVRIDRQGPYAYDPAPVTDGGAIGTIHITDGNGFGVDPSTISLYLNSEAVVRGIDDPGIEYDGISGLLTVNLLKTKDFIVTNGEYVRISLTSASDRAGNLLQNPTIWEWRVDYSSSTGGSLKLLTVREGREPAVSPDGGKVAFVSLRGGNDDIWLIESDDIEELENTAVSLTGSIVRESDPARLSSEGQPAWSPDGTRIAFTSDAAGIREVYIVRVAEPLEITRLTNSTLDLSEPTWLSNDTIVFEKNGELWKQKLTAAVPEILHYESYGNLKEPCVSNELDRIALRKSIYDDTIRIFNVDNKSLEKVTTGPLDFHPSWLPGDSGLLYSRKEGGFYRLWTSDLENMIKYRILENTSNTDDCRAASSPDGKNIYFQSSRSGEWNIWVLSMFDLENLYVEPAVFSPNDDGIKDITELYFTISIDGVWITVDILDDAGNTVFPSFENAKYQSGSYRLAWHGYNDADPAGIVPSGIYSFVITARSEETGEEIRKTVKVTVQKEAPTLSLALSGNYGVFVNNNTVFKINRSYAGNSLAQLQHIYYRTDPASEWIESGASQFKFDVPANSFNFQYKAIDDAGNYTSVYGEPLIGDNIAPVTLFTSESGKTYFDDSNLFFADGANFTLNATDTGCGVKYIRYSIGSSGDLTYDTPVVVTGRGSRLIRFYAGDNLFNNETVQEQVILMDPDPPEALNITFSGYDTEYFDGITKFFTGSAVECEISSNDGASGVKIVEYKLDADVSWNEYTGAIGQFTSGSHVISYRSIDNVGNVTRIFETAFEITDSVPYSAITMDPAPYIDALGRIFVKDALIGFTWDPPATEVMYRIHPNDPISFTGPESIFTLPNPGMQVISFYSYDNLAGASLEDERIYTIYVDNLSPLTTVAFAGEHFNNYISGSTGVIFTAVDQGLDEVSGVKEILYAKGTSDQYQPYTIPLLSGPSEESVTYHYYSEDNTGNPESPENSITLDIDRLPPIVELSGVSGNYLFDNASGKVYVSGLFELGFTSSDTGSGVRNIYYLYDLPEDGSAWNIFSANFEDFTENTRIYYFADDNVGNSSGISERQIITDNQGPQLYLSSSMGIYEKDGYDYSSPDNSFYISGTDVSGIDKITYTIDGYPIGGSDYSDGMQIPSPDKDGFRIGYKGIDLLNNESQYERTISVDSDIPVSSISVSGASYDPGSGYLYITSSTVLSISATDRTSGIANTEWRINNMEWTDGNAPLIGSEETFLEYRSLDNVGNLEAVKSTVIYVDDNSPVTSIARYDDIHTDGVNYYVTPGTSVFFSVSDESGTAYTEYHIDGGDEIVYDESAGVLFDTAGTYNFAFGSTDILGNVETEKEVSIICDLQLPLVTLTCSKPLHITTDDVFSSLDNMFKLNWTDVLIGFVEYQIDASGFTPYVEDTEFPLISAGAQPIEVKAWNDAARTMLIYQKTWPVYVDNTPPSGSIAFDPDYIIETVHYASSVTDITLTGTDTADVKNSGVKEIQYSINKGNYVVYTAGFHPYILSGIEEIDYTIVDNVGNEESYNETYSVDGIPPLTYISFTGIVAATQQGLRVTSGSNGFSFISSDPGTITTGVDLTKYRFDDDAWLDYVSDSVIDLAPLSSGLHEIGYHSIDNLSNMEDERIFPLYIDNDAPAVTYSVIPYVYTDATGDYWISGTARISLSATDIFPDVIRYRMGATGEFDDYCAPLSIAQEGDYLLSYYGIDKVGNTSATEDFSFNVDTDDPDISYAVTGDSYSPATGTIYVKDSTTFDLSATDPGSGVKSTQYSTDSIFWVNSAQYLGGYSETGTPLYFRGVDNVGNFSEIGPVNSILDETAPSLDFTINGFYINREGNYAETITENSYTISAEDLGSGIYDITYSINGGSSIITNSDEVEFILDTTGLYIINYSAVDNIGNSTGDYEFTINVTDEINCVLAISDKPLYETDTQLFASLDYVFTLENRCPGSAFDSIEYNNDSVEGTYLTYSIPLYPSAQPIYSIFYKAVNTGDGTYGPDGELIVDIDDLAPDSTLATSGPSSGTYVNHETLFTISVSEHSSYSTSGVRNSYFKYGTEGYSIYDVPFTITSEDGQVTVSYYSEDNVFNTETENTEDFIMDNTPPEITLTATDSYGEDPLYVLSTTDITLLFTDVGCGEDSAQCYYKVDDGAYILYSAPFPVTGQGSHVLTVKSADLLGNETEKITYDIFLDEEDPTALISVASGPAYIDASSDLYVSTETYFGISGTDSGSGLDDRYYSIDGGTDIEYTQDFNMTLSDGSHTISAYVSDNLGNISTTVDKTVILDSIPPSVPDLTTAVLTFDGVLLSFTGSTDAHSGVNSYILSRNNKKIADIAFGAVTYLDEVLPEGYVAEYTLCAVDNVLNISGESSISLTVTDLPPVVTLTSNLTKFSPDGDECEDQVIFTLNVSDDRGIEYWTLDITSLITGEAVYSIAGAAETINYIFTWDGNDASGLPAPEGTYTCTLTAEDLNGNQDIGSVSVDLDTTRKITTIALDNTIEFPTGYFAGQPIFNSSGEIVTYMLSRDQCRSSSMILPQPGMIIPYRISRNAEIWNSNIDGTLNIRNVNVVTKPAGWPWWRPWNPPPTDVPKLSFDDNYLAYFRGYRIEILDLINNTTDIIDESVLEWDHVWNKRANDLAFISRTEGGTTLKIYNASGISTVTELYDFSYGIDWSNNGQFLAVNGTPNLDEQGNPCSVYTVNLAGSDPVYQKISDDNEWCWQPLISPDNRKIAYFSWVAGNTYGIKVAFLDEAGNMQDYNGAPVVEIADFDVTTSDAVDMIGWSSDSKYIYYALTDNMIPGRDCYVGRQISLPDPFGGQPGYTIIRGRPDILEYSIGKVDFLGRNDAIIANNMEIAATSFGYATAYPAISRDGTKIVYSEYNSEKSGNISILGLTEHPECEQTQWNVPGSVMNLECDVIATVDPRDLLSPVDTIMICSLPVNSIPGANTNLENIEPLISEVYDIKLLSGQTEFNNSIELTFTYTDEEVEGLDETRLQVWTYNDESGMWHIAQTDNTLILRDTSANSLTVMVDSISGLFILSGYYGDETRPEFISSTVIPLYFSPNADNCLDICELRFTMNKFARADLKVFDRGGNVLFEDHRYVLPNEESTFIWNGLSSDGTAYTDELYAFELTAVDVEGLESNVYYESVYIDLISPVSSVNFNGSIYQTAGTTFVSDMSNLEISSVDGGLYSSGVESVMFSIDGSELQQYLMPVYFSGLEEGPHEIAYYGKDNACNTEISSSASFTVDSTPPEIALDYHPFKISGVNTLVFKGTLFSLITQDPLSGVKNIQYRVASASGQNDTGWMNYVDQFVLPFSIPGKYTISYKASDNVDNTTEEFTVEVILVPATETIVAASEFERVLLLNGEGFEEPESFEFMSELSDLLIVDNIVDFVDEMRTGIYNVYWINEKDDNLPGSTSEELKEHVFSGKGLLSSGYIHMISEGGSPELFNLKYTGEYPENSYIIDVSDSVISNAGTIPVEGWIQRLEVYDATVVSQEIPGTITISGNDPAPVISLNSFGEGKASYYGFDLLNNAGNISMEEIISRNIDYFAPANTGEYLPGMVAVVTINVIADISTDIRIIETVPQNVEILKAYDSGVIDENTITFDFASSESEFSARYLIRIPDYSGDLDFITNTLYKVENIWFDSETVQRNITVASTVAGLKESIMEKLAEISAITQNSNKIGNAIKIFERLAEYPGTIEELDKVVSDILKSIGNVRQVIDVDTKECLLQMDKLLLYYESLYREVEE
ncbi:PD40 domain-containing protein [bacterium]|nr:PD40 domain-containing protein [bacterium]